MTWAIRTGRDAGVTLAARPRRAAVAGAERGSKAGGCYQRFPDHAHDIVRNPARRHRLGGRVSPRHLAAAYPARADPKPGKRPQRPQPPALRPDRPAVAAGAGQTLGPAATELGADASAPCMSDVAGLTRFSAFLDRAAPAVDALAGDRPAAARTLPGLAGHPALRPRRERGRRHRTGHLLPGDPPTRLGRQPADHRGVLPRRHPAAPPRLTRQLAEHVMAQVEAPANLDRWPHPRGPADHPDLDPVRAARHRRLHPGLRLPAPRRAGRRLPALLQPQDAPRGRRPDRRGTRDRDPRPAAAGRRPLARRTTRTCSRPLTGNAGGQRPMTYYSYRGMLNTWLADLRRPRRTRPARPPDPAPVAAHLRLPADQPRRPPRGRPGPARPRVDRDDRPLRPDHRPNRPPPLGSKPPRSTSTVSGSASTPTGRWPRRNGPKPATASPPRPCRTATADCRVQKTCPHANACLTCPVFLTGPEFLPELREHRGRTLTLIDAADRPRTHPRWSR